MKEKTMAQAAQEASEAFYQLGEELKKLKTVNWFKRILLKINYAITTRKR